MADAPALDQLPARPGRRSRPAVAPTWSNVEDAGLTALNRSWAIKTDVIEGLYLLEEAQTQTLIERGFTPENIPQSGTGEDPENLPAMLRDQTTGLGTIYVDALEAADDGDLNPLVACTARLHRKATLRAMATW